MKRSTRLIALALLFTVAGVASAQKADIATPGPGSIMHSAGTVLAKVISEKSGLAATVLPFGGPNVFIPAVNAGDVPLGIDNPYDLASAIDGKGYFAGRQNTNLRAVAILFPLRNSMYVKKSSSLKTIADLKGHTMPDGYYSQKVMLPILEALYATAGLTRNDVKNVPVASAAAGADALASGKIDAFVYSLGGAKLREVDAAVGGIRALQIDASPQNLAALQKTFPGVYFRPEKPGPDNPGVVEPVYSMVYDAVMFASTKTADEVVYKAVKAIYEGKADLGAAFPPFKLVELHEMAKKIPIPYHPGAIRFFQEKGMWPAK